MQRFTTVVRVGRLYTTLTSPIAFLTRFYISKISRLYEDSNIDGTLLDVGSGTAPYRRVILDNLNISLYISLEIAPSDATNVIGDAAQLPFGDGVISWVTSFEVIQHISKFQEALLEMFRVLKPGGKLLITFPFNYAECDVRDFRRWTLEGMENELKEAGFNILFLKQRGGCFFAFSCAVDWMVTHLIPGNRKNWRKERTYFSLLSSVIIVVIKAPILLFEWLMLGVDFILPNKGCYIGGVVLAEKPKSTY